MSEAPKCQGPGEKSHDARIAHDQREVIQRLVESIRALQNPQNFRCDPTHDSLRARDAALDSSRDALIIAAPYLLED